MHENTATYGLIGFPLEHSLSPYMHNTAFKALEVDAVYKLFPLEADAVKGFIAALREKDCPIFGINVTVPYKEKVLPLLDILSPFARQVGAVNTVTISKKRQLTGHNTDGPGFLSHLLELKFDLKDKRVAILGAGGASRALVSSLCLFNEKIDSIRIFDVDLTKAQHLMADLGERMNIDHVQAVDTIEDLNVELADLLINATPIGLKKGDPSLVPPEVLHANMLVYDLIYNPGETRLLKDAKSRGAQVSNGLGMLFYQGVLAFQHWSQTELPAPIKKKMRTALNEGKVV